MFLETFIATDESTQRQIPELHHRHLLEDLRPHSVQEICHFSKVLSSQTLKFKSVLCF
jgi:hypothetical protein